MGKQDAVIRYKTSMSVFKNWAAKGLINEEELSAIDTMIAQKYEISLSSIYREKLLQCAER